MRAGSSNRWATTVAALDKYILKFILSILKPGPSWRVSSNWHGNAATRRQYIRASTQAPIARFHWYIECPDAAGVRAGAAEPRRTRGARGRRARSPGRAAARAARRAARRLRHAARAPPAPAPAGAARTRPGTEPVSASCELAWRQIRDEIHNNSIPDNERVETTVFLALFFNTYCSSLDLLVL